MQAPSCSRLRDAQAVRALKAGAAGNLLKSRLRTELIDAIRDVHSGHRHVTREVANEIAAHVVDETLSERERDAPAGRDRQGEQASGVGTSLVGRDDQGAHDKGHMKNNFAKLGVADRTHTVTLAARRGIIES